jgi:hypothetical protein
VALGDVEPAGHTEPALQFPLHVADDRPDVAPNVPAGHSAVQDAVARPDVLP